VDECSHGLHTGAGSSFGAVLAAWVAGTPGARGAVLCDDAGDAVDYAHDPTAVSALDIQLVGAQLSFATTVVTRWARRAGLGRDPVTLLECRAAIVVTSAPATGFFAAGLLGRPANLGRCLRNWDGAMAKVRALLA